MVLVHVMPWLAGGGAVAFLAYVAAQRDEPIRGTWLLPAATSAAFFVWSLWSVAIEGPIGFWTEHTRNLWGNQIWFDLLLAIAIAWWLIVPDARTLGMRVWLWMIFIICTGCIGFTAMIARFLYLKDKQPQHNRSPA